MPMSKIAGSGIAVFVALFAQAVSAEPTAQRVLLAPLDAASHIQTAGWQMANTASAPATADVKPQWGESALTFSGNAQIAGGKGDFPVYDAVPGQCRHLGLWVYLKPDANVASVGLQIQDAEGEVLAMQVPANWTGWKSLVFDTVAGPVKQAYAQADKNGRLDLPIRAVHIAWFATAPGKSEVTVNALTADTVLSDKPSAPVTAAMSGSAVGEPGEPYRGAFVLTNFTDTVAKPSIQYSVQRDPALYAKSVPDPVYGNDRALGAKSWTEENGKRIEEGSLTDGRDWTAAETEWGQHTEAFQYIDLGKSYRVTRLAYQSGDANWTWKVDVSASDDGKIWVPINGLQSLDWHGKWGVNIVDVPEPFAARFLRFRHHNGGEKVNVIRMPSSLMVYSGVGDDKIEIPAVGPVVTEGTLTPDVPAHAFTRAAFATQTPLAPGAYLVAAKITTDGASTVTYSHYFVTPPALPHMSQTDSAKSRFGVNASVQAYAPLHERLGIGWVRFENMKWMMISPKEGEYRYDGTVGPWNVRHDDIMAGYAKRNLNILPFLFQTAKYASSAPASDPKARWDSFPPKDNKQYADFVYQTVSRYGSAKHAASELETADKVSGLGQIHVFELWNEQNLTAPSWGPWVGTASQYFEMFRAGAEAAKRADPNCQIANGGWAGCSVETVDPMVTYKYADGTRPIDYADILNVHYYSGRVAPEIATVDGNADRSEKKDGARTFEEDLRMLVAWRNANKPSMPIWMTETGYDSAGPFGTDERTEAARLPRVVMMMLAAGIDKVFVYREAGSTPSMHAASGLVRNDGSQKPLWFTYATLIRQLDGVTKGVRLPVPDPNVRVYAWTKGTETILSAWTIEGNGDLPIILGKVTATDAFGSTTQPDIEGHLPLSVYPVYIRDIANPSAVNALIAQAKASEQERADREARQAKLKAYLFDFGSADKVGTVAVGGLRKFTPVLAKEIFDDGKGYGFTPGPAMSDDTQGWINDPLECDSCHVNGGIQFEFKPAAGKYHLKLSAAPFAAAGRVTIKGGAAGDIVLDVSQQNPLAEADLESSGSPLVVSFDSYCAFRWLSLIERL